jgi:hypothetical protein
VELPFTKTIIRKTIFAQFVGGETLQETAAVAKKLGEYHVQVILDYGVEGGDDGEPGFEHCYRRIHQGDQLCSNTAQHTFYECEGDRLFKIRIAGKN